MISPCVVLSPTLICTHVFLKEQPNVNHNVSTHVDPIFFKREREGLESRESETGDGEKRGMGPERGDMRGEGRMKCVLLLELWLPVSISLQEAVNELRANKTCFIYSYISKSKSFSPS